MPRVAVEKFTFVRQERCRFQQRGLFSPKTLLNALAAEIALVLDEPEAELIFIPPIQLRLRPKKGIWSQRASSPAPLVSDTCLLVLSKTMQFMCLRHVECHALGPVTSLCVCLVHWLRGNTLWTCCKDRVKRSHDVFISSKHEWSCLNVLYSMMSEMTLTVEACSLLTCARVWSFLLLCIS